jgi:hypothetical protein
VPRRRTTAALVLATSEVSGTIEPDGRPEDFVVNGLLGCGGGWFWLGSMNVDGRVPVIEDVLDLRRLDSMREVVAEADTDPLIVGGIGGRIVYSPFAALSPVHVLYLTL